MNIQKTEHLAFLISNHLKNKKLNTFPLEKFTLKNYSKLFTFVENNYNRNIVYRNKQFEIVTIYWDEKSKSPFHSHPEQGCILKVISGTLKENLLLNNNEMKVNILNKDNTSYLDNSIGIHQIEALKPTKSIHIYSPPGFYDCKK
ncbi:putative type I cysteine dioxygenase [Cafeteria roenbergensis virus]|uniref:Putative type I cysteine dioxygenase n=1 Tax=Cafeteria roenbergensis virus (strain BV-PW1) TaxID=693272 RepID=E3T5I4_CROVB|nr:putative type I cysteine dioxygenase [Cafeteria roenbergensis virus BV-PW1]ADO67447.1 putative type I cysteine dioxygenase [Cafeteria roenbergensis virus BV-PW1]